MPPSRSRENSGETPNRPQRMLLNYSRFFPWPWWHWLFGGNHNTSDCPWTEPKKLHNCGFILHYEMDNSQERTPLKMHHIRVIAGFGIIPKAPPHTPSGLKQIPCSTKEDIHLFCFLCNKIEKARPTRSE